MNRKMICIVCPMGCEMEIEKDESGKVIGVSGNRCPHGKVYADKEAVEPMRMLTSTVRIDNGIYSRLPVITSQSIPKDKIKEVMQAIHQVHIKAPVQLGQVIIPKVCGLDADIVASRSMRKVEKSPQVRGYKIV